MEDSIGITLTSGVPLKSKGGRWSCLQHGDACKSYVAFDIFNKRGLNGRKVTPNDVPFLEDDERLYISKCLKWIPDGGS